MNSACVMVTPMGDYSLCECHLETDIFMPHEPRPKCSICGDVDCHCPPMENTVRLLAATKCPICGTFDCVCPEMEIITRHLAATKCPICGDVDCVCPIMEPITRHLAADMNLLTCRPPINSIVNVRTIYGAF